MIKILANDGIAADGKALLEAEGYEVVTDKIPQEELAGRINDYDVLVVRSATKVTADILNNAKRLKLVVRAGVGIDNIDVKAAEANGIAVSNTPNSSSLSVAELVFAHLFTMVRFLYEANREMPTKGRSHFKELKKKYEQGVELRGKTLGIIGFGRIGQETAKLAIGLGMKIIVFNRTPMEKELVFDHLPFRPVPAYKVKTISMEEVLKNSDFISLHVPHSSGQPALIGEKQLQMMKKGAAIVNCARGGVVDEKALAKALESGQISFAALDVFENEPNVDEELLKVEGISFSPHIGASTQEAQQRVGQEVAEVIIERLKRSQN